MQAHELAEGAYSGWMQMHKVCSHISRGIAQGTEQGLRFGPHLASIFGKRKDCSPIHGIPALDEPFLQREHDAD